MTIAQYIGAFMLGSFWVGLLYKFALDFGVRDTVLIWGGAFLAAGWLVTAILLLGVAA